MHDNDSDNRMENFIMILLAGVWIVPLSQKCVCSSSTAKHRSALLMLLPNVAVGSGRIDLDSVAGGESCGG